MARIGIVGAGLAGLTAASHLHHRHEVTVFEKSKGAGGRMATRYADSWEFDHGAQFFTAHSTGFRNFCGELAARGLIAPWQARFEDLKRSTIAAERVWNDDFPHYVAAPRMNALGKALARNLDVRFETAIVSMQREKNRWLLLDKSGERGEPFDWVIMAVPAPQAAALAPAGSALRERCLDVVMKPCFALMLGFDTPVDWSFDAAHVANADISWISVNSSKPGRESGVSVVVHSTNAWAASHLETSLENVKEHLLDQFADIVGEPVSDAAHIGIHRWRYANVDKRTGERCFLDPRLQLAACGDWFIRGRVEAAWLSGASLAAQLGGADIEVR